MFSFPLALKSALLLSIGAVLTINVLAQNDGDSVVLWSANKLKPEDFRKEFRTFGRLPGATQKISSWVDIVIKTDKYKKGDSTFKYHIYSVFYKNGSWINDTSLLEHEQLHFDISELYARKMRMALHLASNNPSMLKKSNKMLDEIYGQYEDCHARYDRETNFGAFPNMQFVWQRQISRQLDSLSQYSQEKGQLYLEKRR